jgi:hypothetical protein
VPIEELLEPSKLMMGFRVINPEGLLILKLCARVERTEHRGRSTTRCSAGLELFRGTTPRLLASASAAQLAARLQNGPPRRADRGLPRRAYIITRPPSTASTCPVM